MMARKTIISTSVWVVDAAAPRATPSAAEWTISPIVAVTFDDFLFAWEGVVLTATVDVPSSKDSRGEYVTVECFVKHWSRQNMKINPKTRVIPIAACGLCS